MAAVLISPPPAKNTLLSTMSARRAPLHNNTNAVNSPFRPTDAQSKSKRSYATIQREESYGQPPPAKKQMLENRQALKTPPRQNNTNTHYTAEGRVFRKPNNVPQRTAFERKCAATRVKTQSQHAESREKGQELDTIRQWQRHYRKIFPTFVFYFESIPDDSRAKYTKQVIALGGREEKFFSNAVTHVVTTRSIPPELPAEVAVASSTTTESNSQNSQPQTINPSLLDRSSESTNVQSDSFSVKGKFSIDPQLNRRLGAHAHDVEVRRQQNRSSDVLVRARELNMKIWALEKLQRIMTTMFDTETGLQIPHGHNTRSNAAGTIPRGTADLAQVLRNEKINGPSDRDPTVATKELCIFKGPYIYIYDIDEKQRPIMVREYPKVAHKELGEWPQFRSVTGGRCPFVEEPESRREAEREKEQIRLQRQKEKEKAMAPRVTRAASAGQNAKMQPPTSINKQVMTEADNGRNKTATVSSKQANIFAPSKPSYSQQRNDSEASRGNAFVSRAGTGRLLAGEPVASGLQASNVTSAIRSQMISSTAAQPGAKAGTSKEVHGLQRKVLEKNSGGPASYGMTSSHRMTDLNAAVREDLAGLAARRKKKLPLIEEDKPSENEENARKTEATRKAKAVQQRKADKRDPKPGYCENCQDKFDDFDEHIASRKHRKFAEKDENWAELDQLLTKLARPLKEEQDDY
ncbi:hypothetical protein HYFRA_00007929 [Hymenoscyphus fraxineus]|uniref:DBF4-type domain-containing protein n=1 Tax=Hymenoscyphus fraxineus TaxID=746836 RepID=A0A9N9KSE7_9HELO|nr:hypothetical protein HYFRA_00007929 [Hymenoscyphus fraxineus]